MSSIVSHKPHMGGSYPIPLNDLQPGMVVEFTYRKDSVGQPEVKRYTVMIVDPQFRRPQDKEDFTHAINLEVAPRSIIVELAKQTGSTFANSNLQYRPQHLLFLTNFSLSQNNRYYNHVNLFVELI